MKHWAMSGSSRAANSKVLELDGMLWKPKSGSACGPDKFIASRTLFMQLYAEAEWNPWVLNDRAEDLLTATARIGQWTRAEPGFRQLTAQQLDACLVRGDRRITAERANAELRRERDRGRYDAD
jgi:hypothetical protein